MKEQNFSKTFWQLSVFSMVMFVGLSLGYNAAGNQFFDDVTSEPDYHKHAKNNSTFEDDRNGGTSSRGITNVINDSSFEMGPGSGAWNEFSSTFGTPLCDATCGDGGGTGAHTGSWWCWFGGIDTTDEIGYVDQDITITPGIDSLYFYLEIPVGQTPGFMKVIIDDDTLWTVTEADSYPTYSQVSVNVSAYADSAIHNLKFYSETRAGGFTNFFIDDISLDIITTGIGAPITNAPTNFALKQNYPNPFNPLTTIAYQLPGNTHVELRIYNLAGQEITTLVNQRQSAGLKQIVWNGLDENGHPVASGIYTYRLHAGNYIETRKMVLLK